MQQAETLKPKNPEPQKPGSTDEWYNRVKAQLEQNPGVEKAKAGEGKERGEKGPQWLQKLMTSVGDFGRDVMTANEMAKDKFERTAFSYGLQAVLTGGAGVGIEAALGPAWDSMWQGKKTFIERFEIAPSVAEKLNAFILDNSNDWKARVGYFIKEGSEDLAIAGIYNLLFTWRMQRLFKAVEPEHLASSLAIDALEALLSPKLPDDMRKIARESRNTMQMTINEKINRERRDLEQDYRNAEQRGKKYSEVEYVMQAGSVMAGRHGGENAVIPAKMGFKTKVEQTNQEELDEILGKIQSKQGEIRDEIDVGVYSPEGLEKIIRPFIKYNNPVTNLAVAMFTDASVTLWINYRKVHKVRKEKGGLAGKSVYMPKQDRDRGSGYRGQDKRQWEDRKDKVYYGKSSWQQHDEPVKHDNTKEEELREKFD